MVVKGQDAVFVSQQCSCSKHFCRLCRMDVEDEVHVLLRSEGSSDLLVLRASFWHDVIAMVGNVHCEPDLFKRLVGLLNDQRLTQRLAKYTFLYSQVSRCTYHHPTLICHSQLRSGLAIHLLCDAVSPLLGGCGE